MRLQNDSLLALIRSESSRQRQYDLMQDSFRKKLIAACSRYLEKTESIPPLAAKNMRSMLSFLQSELTTKNIDNIEGLQRLAQVQKDFDAVTGSIQIAQGSSPVPEIRGTVYRLRIGCLSEAAVDVQATKYALWKGADSSGNALWELHSDPDGAAKIMEAVNIREGKALPAFAHIPFSMSKETKQ
jgi:hypothetical protein